MKVIQATSFVPPRLLPPPHPPARQRAAWEIAHETALPRCGALLARSLLTPWRPEQELSLPSAVTALLAEACALSYEPGGAVAPCLEQGGFRDVELFRKPLSEDSARQRAVASDASLPVRALGFCDDRHIFLAFRGTRTWSLEDWIYNLSVAVRGRPRRHAGFQRAWTEIAPQVRIWLEPRLGAGRALYLAGHSLGGAIATIAAWELASRVPIGGVVTLGSPRVGGRAFADDYAGQPAAPTADGSARTLREVTLRYQHGIDIVARAMPPPLWFEHVVPAKVLPPQKVCEGGPEAGATLVRDTAAPAEVSGEVLTQVVVTHWEYLASTLGLVVAYALSRFGWTGALPLHSVLGRLGVRGYYGERHHRAAIYATLLSPGKILRKDWLTARRNRRELHYD